MNDNDKDCRHCQLKPAVRARGLCAHCFADPSIRDRYPTLATFRHGHGSDPTQKRTVGQPTSALPGTQAKLQVLCDRAAANEILFHPDDARDKDAAPGYLHELGATNEGGPPYETPRERPGRVAHDPFRHFACAG